MLLESLVESVSLPLSWLQCSGRCWLVEHLSQLCLSLSLFPSCSFCFIHFAFNYLFSFWLHWVFVVFSSCLEPGAALSLLCAGFSLTTGCRHMVLSSCGVQLNCPEATGGPGWNRVPCVGRRFPNLWTAREIPIVIRFILALLFVFYYSVAALSVFTWPCF